MLTVQQEVNDVTLFQTPLLLCEDSLPWLKQHKDIVKISVLMWATLKRWKLKCDILVKFEVWWWSNFLFYGFCINTTLSKNND